MTVLLVVLCGGVGAVARFVVDAQVQAQWPGAFPLGTLAVNLTGSFVLGLLAGLHASQDVLLILGTATIGSYTTFSTWMLEVHRPAEDGDRRIAGMNLAVSLVLGVGFVAAGKAIGTML